MTKTLVGCVRGMAVGLSALLCSGVGVAAAADDAPRNGASAILGRYFASPMYSRTFADTNRLTKDGNGGMLTVGKQVHPNVLVELGFIGMSFGAESGEPSATLYGGSASLDYFPWAQSSWVMGGLYGLVGVGVGNSDLNTSPNSTGQRYLFDVGIGYLLPIIGDVSLRFDARYRFDQVLNPYGDYNGKVSSNRSGFEDVVVSVGLLIPLGSRPAPPAEEPVKVIAQMAACSDKIDNGREGKVDIPNEPGCALVNDADENRSAEILGRKGP